jgi:hypothetical protein
MVRFDTYNASAHLVRQLELSGRITVVHDGGDNLLVQLDTEELISIYLIETVMPPYEIRQTLAENNAANIHTLFVLWGEMFLPENGEVFVPDEWLTVLAALYGGRIYAFGVYGKDIHIFPVYFDRRGHEYVIHYGKDVNLAQLACGTSSAGTALIGEFSSQPRQQKSTRQPISRTPWDILGVAREETDREAIKRVYRQLAMKLHPDKNHSHNATEQMQTLNEAYNAVLRSLDAAEKAS